MTKDALAILASLAVSSISTAVLYQRLGFSGWESVASVGGAVLFFVILILLGKVFNLSIIGALLWSAVVTGFIMFFIYVPFGAFFLIFGGVGLLLATIWENQD